MIINFKIQRLQVRQKTRRPIYGRAPAPLSHDQAIADLEPKQGRHNRTVGRNVIDDASGILAIFVIESQSHDRRCVEN
jgi:hypothetical protein